MTLLAGFKALLWRYTSRADLVVGAAIAGRTRAETEPLIGFFVNTLALRTDLSGDPTFAELLKRVREVTLGGYAHQEVPFEKLVEELQPERRAGVAPLFQVAFGLQNAPMGELRLEGLRLSPVEFAQEQVRFDLTVWAWEREGGLEVAWSYSRDVLSGEAVEAMHGHYEQLLRQAVAQPGVRLSALDHLTAEEKEQQISKEVQQEEAILKKLMVAKRKSVRLKPQA
jgi:non-ribosomal peptide synthetase component F